MIAAHHGFVFDIHRCGPVWHMDCWTRQSGTFTLVRDTRLELDAIVRGMRE